MFSASKTINRNLFSGVYLKHHSPNCDRIEGQLGFISNLATACGIDVYKCWVNTREAESVQDE